MVTCVIPAYRAASSILSVVGNCLLHADLIIVVDDGCPDESGLVVECIYRGNNRVEVLRHQRNRGVGAAMKTGFRRALQRDATVVVKVDADGQMDPSVIPYMTQILDANRRVSFVKGNRFYDGSIAKIMPGVRLFGNSALTLLVRLTTGYWNSIDPTNGFFAIRSSALRRIDFNRIAERYFFEISLLVQLGFRRAEIAEIEIPARYGNERSSLSVWNTVFTFPGKLGTSFVRRLIWQYVISDMNVGSLFLIFGTLFLFLGTVLGSFAWFQALRTGIPRTPGTVSIVLLPIIVGFQLLLNAIVYDVQFSPRVYKFSEEDRSQQGVPEECEVVAIR